MTSKKQANEKEVKEWEAKLLRFAFKPTDEEDSRIKSVLPKIGPEY